VVDNDDIGHQVASRNGGFRSSKHVIGAFEPVQCVGSMVRLQGVERRDPRHEPVHNGYRVTHGSSLPQADVLCPSPGPPRPVRCSQSHALLSPIDICFFAMPPWKVIDQAEPEFAARVRRLMEAGRHKTIATLRADGSPRISGIECEFTDADLRFGSMAGARKGADLKRDPRFALHGPTFHPGEGKENEWPGEAKVTGRAIRASPETTVGVDEEPDGDMFIADISEVVITALNADATMLVVESWTPERGLQRVERV
jgi:hypothetical protein